MVGCYHRKVSELDLWCSACDAIEFRDPRDDLGPGEA
jgi:hypothetical protein